MLILKIACRYSFKLYLNCYKYTINLIFLFYNPPYTCILTKRQHNTYSGKILLGEIDYEKGWRGTDFGITPTFCNMLAGIERIYGHATLFAVKFANADRQHNFALQSIYRYEKMLHYLFRAFAFEYLGE